MPNLIPYLSQRVAIDQSMYTPSRERLYTENAMAIAKCFSRNPTVLCKTTPMLPPVDPKHPSWLVYNNISSRKTHSPHLSMSTCRVGAIFLSGYKEFFCIFPG
ncbi:uncharacterized protein G2W53_022130 [Senna tora]|uniref:Uncharacterized protein n=1 Tax=Senna tora TaxID=362788 RepID=A0A834WLR9_9FABA|nr:uncharacterized protein G2W53_022130 [Senna tora]